MALSPSALLCFYTECFISHAWRREYPFMQPPSFPQAPPLCQALAGAVRMKCKASVLCWAPELEGRPAPSAVQPLSRCRGVCPARRGAWRTGSRSESVAPSRTRGTEWWCGHRDCTQERPRRRAGDAETHGRLRYLGWHTWFAQAGLERQWAASSERAGARPALHVPGPAPFHTRWRLLSQEFNRLGFAC